MGMSTRQAGQRLGKTGFYMRSLIDSGRIPAPPKDATGNFVWSEQDLENARKAITIDRRRPAYRAQTAATCPQ